MALSPTKTTIQEANKHLQMVHARVSELERAMARQKSEFFQRDQERQIHFEELLKIKEAEIVRLKEQNMQSANVVSELKLKLKESNRLISDLHDKSRVFDEVIQCKPVLESMVRLLHVYESTQQRSESLTSKHSSTLKDVAQPPIVTNGCPQNGLTDGTSSGDRSCDTLNGATNSEAQQQAHL